MPWQNQGGGGPWGGGGGGGNGGGPWGGRGSGGGGSPWGRGGGQPPNIEELLRRSQDRFRRVMPQGLGGGKGALLIALLAVLLWMASGFYRVAPDEQGVVLRFGEWVRTTQPGLNYHLPAPIETALTPNVTRENRIEIGFRSAAEGVRAASKRDMLEESLMLTGDENIVDIGFVVFWRVKDAGEYLFKVRDPELTVKAAAESALREVVGQKTILVAFTEGRAQIEVQTTELLQKLLDSYQTGVLIRQVQLLEVDPPSSVVDAFNEVQRARADKERLRNEADAYRNDVVPRARGDAERLIQEGRAYKEEVVNRAQGDANRFNSVYTAYKVSPDVTTRRIYLETMQEVLRNTNKLIVDKSAASGVVPYLPLPELQKHGPASPGSPTGPASTAPGGAPVVRTQ
ncbi:MAG: FtsH protease activity modulator HflK [Proteobacteria bacterium]|nr:FtsH protease activity modulator HflK [Pseudomonadota bacterium]MBI3499759.1 FtsH protease activity modulator HflK [Pseudomonadota bacterium]